MRQISHNSGQEYLWKINLSNLNLNRFSSMVARVWKLLSGSVGYIFLVNESLPQQASYAGSVVMPAERNQDGRKTVTAVRL